MKNGEISRILFVEFFFVHRKDLIHLGEMDELRTAKVDLFNPRTPPGRLWQIHVTYPTSNCTNGDTHHRRIHSPLSISIILLKIHYVRLLESEHRTRARTHPASILSIALARQDWPAWIGIVIEEQRPGTAQRKVHQENTIDDP